MELTTRSLPCPEGTKLCPFCGGNPILDHEPDDAVKVPRPTWAVRCRSCAAQGPWSKVSAASAVRDWNTRARPNAPETISVPKTIATALIRETQDAIDHLDCCCFLCNKQDGHAPDCSFATFRTAAQVGLDALADDG